MIPRALTETVLRLAGGFPVVVVTGPRQSGKTTLVRAAFPDKPYVSLEDPDVRQYAAEDGRGFLAGYPDGAIFDEVQRASDLLSYLQGVVDADRRPGRFILTGSQDFALSHAISQTLAGRAGVAQLLPLSAAELDAARLLAPQVDACLFRGGYPELWKRPAEPRDWFAGYVATYLERDVRDLTAVRDLVAFQRFLRLCAARTGQLLNLSSLATDGGISQSTATAWLSILETGYIVFRLTPHFANFGKRLIKTPKLYFHDAGLAAFLLGIQSPQQLNTHAARPALFETLIVGELLRAAWNRGMPSNLYFWRDSTGTEVDVLRDEAGVLWPVEIKSGQTVAGDMLKGLLKWQDLAGAPTGDPWLVFGGEGDHLRRGVRVMGWRALLKHL
jgi:predicted AAA+ superfamily ATPase